MHLVLPNRTYQLSFEHRPEYLYAYLSSDAINYDTAKEYWVEILKMLHRRRYVRMFLEKEVPNRLCAHEVFRLVTELAHSGCSRMKFAILDHHYDYQRSGFEEMVATNRGLRVKIVDNYQDAEEWLLHRDIDFVAHENTRGVSMRAGRS